jgi:hypothetical protein
MGIEPNLMVGLRTELSERRRLRTGDEGSFRGALLQGA